MVLPKPQHCTAIIETKTQVTKSVIFVNFKLQIPSELTFIAGQTICLNIAPGVTRSMSIASPPSDKTHILMCHDVFPGGQGSQWTIARTVGDTVTFIAPLGVLIMDPESHRKKIMIATGTGIVPFRSMVMDYLEKSGTDDVTIYWGMRHEEDLYWVSEFQALSARHPNFRFVITLSKPADSWQGSRGRVTAHVVQEEVNLPGSDFYLCGNQSMIKEINTQLTQYGVPTRQIMKEMFF